MVSSKLPTVKDLIEIFTHTFINVNSFLENYTDT